MKLGTIIGIATLAMAMTLGGAVTPADAGQKGSKKKVHVRLNNNLTDLKVRKLEKAARSLKGPHRDALLGEIEKRRTTHNVNKGAGDVGRMLTERDAMGQILGLGIWGTELGKRRKGGH
jgi:hypothetical protein